MTEAEQVARPEADKPTYEELAAMLADVVDAYETEGCENMGTIDATTYERAKILSRRTRNKLCWPADDMLVVLQAYHPAEEARAPYRGISTLHQLWKRAKAAGDDRLTFIAAELDEESRAAPAAAVARLQRIIDKLTVVRDAIAACDHGT
jgi:hypothetical protein